MTKEKPVRGPSMISSHGRAIRALHSARATGDRADAIFWIHVERALNRYISQIPPPHDKYGDPICIDWNNS